MTIKVNKIKLNFRKNKVLCKTILNKLAYEQPKHWYCKPSIILEDKEGQNEYYKFNKYHWKTKKRAFYPDEQIDLTQCKNFTAYSVMGVVNGMQPLHHKKSCDKCFDDIDTICHDCYELKRLKVTKK